jgi:hypothetical protein
MKIELIAYFFILYIIFVFSFKSAMDPISFRHSNGNICIIHIEHFPSVKLDKVLLKLIYDGSYEQKKSKLGPRGAYVQSSKSWLIEDFMIKALHQMFPRNDVRYDLPLNARLEWFPDESDSDGFSFQIVAGSNFRLSFSLTRDGFVHNCY